MSGGLRTHATVPNNHPTPDVIAMASAPQKVTRIAPTITLAPPACAASPPRSARNSSEVPATRGIQACLRSQGSDQERQDCSDGEAASRCQRRLNRTRTESLGDPEFVAGMRSEEHTSELQSLRHLVC